MSHDEMSLQEHGRRLHEGTISIEDALLFMSRYPGTGAVDLDYDGSNERWECSWIVDGERFHSDSYDMRMAVLGASSKHFVAAAKAWEERGV